MSRDSSGSSLGDLAGHFTNGEGGLAVVAQSAQSERGWMQSNRHSSNSQDRPGPASPGLDALNELKGNFKALLEVDENAPTVYANNRQLTDADRNNLLGSVNGYLDLLISVERRAEAAKKAANRAEDQDVARAQGVVDLSGTSSQALLQTAYSDDVKDLAQNLVRDFNALYICNLQNTFSSVQEKVQLPQGLGSLKSELVGLTTENHRLRLINQSRQTSRKTLYPTFSSKPEVKQASVALIGTLLLLGGAALAMEFSTHGSGVFLQAFTHFAQNATYSAKQVGAWVSSTPNVYAESALGASLAIGAVGLVAAGGKAATWAAPNRVDALYNTFASHVSAGAKAEEQAQNTSSGIFGFCNNAD